MFQKPRILTDSESNLIRGKMLVGAATKEEQLQLVGHFDLVEMKLRGALEDLRDIAVSTKQDWLLERCDKGLE